MTVAGDDFRGLGFNPLPGDPEAIKALECDAREFGRRMIEQADFLGKVAHRDGWQGEAAKVFSQHVETLPKDLHKLGSAFLSLSGAMEKYHARFLLEKGKAKALEQQAVAARQKLNSAQFAYDAPVISAPDTCLPPRDHAPVDTAEDELGAILREAHAFAERFDCSPEVQGLAKAIREFAKNAPDEPRWNIIKRWAGDVFSITPVGAALNAAHDLINQYAEFFNDLANLLSDISGTLGLLSLPLMLLPPAGTAAAVLALAFAAGSATVKTSLYAGHARDANGILYVNGGNLVRAYFDVGMNAVGVGLGAGATKAADAAARVESAVGIGARAGATKAVGAASKVETSFGSALAEQFAAKHFSGTVTAAKEFVGGAKEVGVRGAVKFAAKAEAQRWAQMSGKEALLNGGGVFLSVAGPLPTSKESVNVAGWRSVQHLILDDPKDLFTNAPDNPDLELRVQPHNAAKPAPAPTNRAAQPVPQPVMGDSP